MPAVAVLLLAVLAFASCSTSSKPTPASGGSEVLTADTPRTTVDGNTFIAPGEWKIEVRGPATILAPPEPGSYVVLVDVRAADADGAVAAAWAAHPGKGKWPLKVTSNFPDRDGWSNIRDYTYQTSPNEKRAVFANARRAGDVWTVILYDMDHGVGEKRAAQEKRTMMAQRRRRASSSNSLPIESS